jgi:hypothetical protein
MRVMVFSDEYHVRRRRLRWGLQSWQRDGRGDALVPHYHSRLLRCLEKIVS